MKRPYRAALSFALLLFASSIFPVLAASASEGGEEAPLAEVPAPGPSELAVLESRELEYFEWLSSPEAVSKREASQTAYGGLSASEARNLLLEAFPAQFEALNADPARVLSELDIEQPLGTYAALVADEGERSIVESSIPIQSDLGGEGAQPVDLALEESGSDFVPQNPLVEVSLPGSAEEPVQLQGGLKVQLPSANDHSAQGVGDKNLFYPETETATDTLVSPIAAGVEVFEQIRSPESPEQFSFELGLPAGATLRATEVGGVEVISASDDTIAEVPPPSAVDAQGAEVPVSMSIEGESLLVDVPHRSREVAYPLLLDPQFLEEGQVAYNEWKPASTDAYTLSNTSSLSAVAKGSSYTYGAETHGHWVYTAPGQTTYIAAATFFSNSFNIPENCANEQPTNQPHGYTGLYNPSTGTWVGLGKWSGGTSYSTKYETGWVGSVGVRQAAVGIGTGTTKVSHKCAFTFTVGGVTIQEKDPEAPTIDSVSGTSTKWVKDLTITAQASDPGLGVKGISLNPEGALPHSNAAGCTGTYTSRCQGSYQTSFGIGYFAEGERSANISAFDPLGDSPESDSKHVSSSTSFTTKIDRGKPEVELEGQLAEAIEEAEEEGEVSKEDVPQLALPVYNLKIEAEDGSNKEAKTKRSGVKDIAVFLDGEEMEVPWGAQECPASSCAMTETYPVRLGGLEGGPVHYLKAVVEDQVGNQRERQIEFEYTPATGMKDEYVMQYFPLPDGEGDEEEEEFPKRPELAVNVASGNLVYRQRDVEVPGPAIDLELERFYNSQLPEEEDTEWGDGWTLAQTPELEPEETEEEAPPATARVRRASGSLVGSVGLPTEPLAPQFDKKLGATVTKEPGGSYTVEDQSGETDTSLVFDATGKVQEETSGYAKIEYSYEEGDLAEMEVHDPASAYLSPEQLEELHTEPGLWTTQPTVSPEARTELKLTDVSCASATKCMAVGYNRYIEKAFAESWDGSEWKVVSSNDGTEQIPDVSCVTPMVCQITAVAGGTKGTRIYFQVGGKGWGTTFRSFAVPEGASSWELRDIACSSESACTAVGYQNTASGYKTLVERYDGNTWSIQQSKGAEPSEGNAYKAMSAVSCATATHCMSVGQAASKPVAQVWNGSAWALATVPTSSNGILEGVSCASTTSCVAVGHSGTWDWQNWAFWPEGNALAEIWDGSEWTASELPEPSEEVSASASRLTGISCNTASSCVAAGSFYTEGGPEGKEEKALSEVWDGSEWSTRSTTSPDLFSAFANISCTAAAHCTTVGSARPTYKSTNNMVTLGERVMFPPVPSTEDDPRVEIDVADGHVDNLKGNETALIAYTHKGELLTAVDGQQGETSYDYDSEGHLTKVTLPNGTWGKVTYNELDGRVSSVTVDPAGEEPAKTTYFAYQDSPSRRTTVSPEGAPATVYDIAADGSVLKWWNTQGPPEIESLSGSLYQNKETAEAIPIGDYELVIQANSVEGIASIEVVANGSSLVDEKVCKKTAEENCHSVEDLWVTNTGNWSPGILNLEAIVTDANGNAESAKFWVNVPYTPPPDPEAEEPPTFEDILRFRQAFGLDIDLKGDEQAIDERVFSLISDWYSPDTQNGEVARVTAERWGVPLRAVDVAELEYRREYVEQAAISIPQWAASHAPSIYAGYYVDNRAGGIIHVGFTQSQKTNVQALKEQAGLMVPGRVMEFTITPSHSFNELKTVQESILKQATELPSLTRVSIEVEPNMVKVGTTNSVSAMSKSLTSLLGASAPVSVFFDGDPPEANYTPRDQLFGRVRAGDRVVIVDEVTKEEERVHGCTANFGTWIEHKESRGAKVFKHFLLTAGHCGEKGKEVYREGINPHTEKYKYQTLGHIRRTGIDVVSPDVDSAAVLLEGKADQLAPRRIFMTPNSSLRVTGVGVMAPGMQVCTSGIKTNKTLCEGEVLGPPEAFTYGNFPNIHTWVVPISLTEKRGDSGAPVWEAGTGKALGLWNAGTYPSYVTPLLAYPGAVIPGYEFLGNPAPGAFPTLGFAPGNLSTAR